MFGDVVALTIHFGNQLPLVTVERDQSAEQIGHVLRQRRQYFPLDGEQALDLLTHFIG